MKLEATSTSRLSDKIALHRKFVMFGGKLSLVLFAASCCLDPATAVPWWQRLYDPQKYLVQELARTKKKQLDALLEAYEDTIFTLEEAICDNRRLVQQALAQEEKLNDLWKRTELDFLTLLEKRKRLALLGHGNLTCRGVLKYMALMIHLELELPARPDIPRILHMVGKISCPASDVLLAAYNETVEKRGYEDKGKFLNPGDFYKAMWDELITNDIHGPHWHAKWSVVNTFPSGSGTSVFEEVMEVLCNEFLQWGFVRLPQQDGSKYERHYAPPKESKALTS